ncbi:MAG TPA: ABC transporter ATP-binding protein [Tepidisphaeraceae bacterium]|jgi:ABC-type sugar transport system ATPase subunit|nr:ABC transporter ATP-binding protein [Tepidisphaeraceae bacterium]
MIRLERVSVRVGGFELREVSFEVRARAYAVLMGKTGSGKTTLAEAICGIRWISAGGIWLMEKEVSGWRPGERGIGYVPQDRALFSTMSVYENLAFALRIRKWADAEVEKRVKELGDLLGISAILERRTAGLSGGEAQRVALGRALASRPGILLLDEPLSALDDQTRGEMHELLKSVWKYTEVTVLHITHHVADAENLADRLLMLENGKVREAEMGELRVRV